MLTKAASKYFFKYFKQKYISIKIFVFFLLRILFSRILFRLNFLLSFPVLREKQLLEFLYRFRPYETNFSLIRLGEVGDGGYLIPDDFLGGG